MRSCSESSCTGRGGKKIKDVGLSGGSRRWASQKADWKSKGIRCQLKWPRQSLKWQMTSSIWPMWRVSPEYKRLARPRTGITEDWKTMMWHACITLEGEQITHNSWVQAVPSRRLGRFHSLWTLRAESWVPYLWPMKDHVSLYIRKTMFPYISPYNKHPSRIALYFLWSKAKWTKKN